MLASSSTDVLAAPRPSKDDLARARVLDREGVKAFGEGRYNDAVRFFDEAYRLGGPPFELWNVAKCYLRLDEPEQAAETLERYLALENLPPDDRKEASDQLEELRRRESTLTVSSNPTGASVSVDGKPIEGRTPVSTTVAPGTHTVTVTSDKHASYTRQIDAHYGRAVIVDASLVHEDRPPPPGNPYEEKEDRRFAVRGIVAAILPRFGEIGGDATPGALVSGTYRISEGSPAVAIGALVSISADSWGNSVNAPSTVRGCDGTLPGSFGATAISLYGIGTAGFGLGSRLRVVGVGGVGVAGYIVPDTGGDVFAPSCTSSPGLRPALMLGGQLDYALTSSFRLTAMPINLQLMPAFSGVRRTPLDASGLWMRFGIGIGAGVDF